MTTQTADPRLAFLPPMAQRLLRAKAARTPETEYLPTAPPTLEAYWQARYPRYQLAGHIRLMLAELASLGDGEGLIITIAPRHSKSESIKAWLEWSLGQHPQDEAILASYSIDLARRHSRSIRNEIAGTGSGAFQRAFPGVVLSSDSAAASDWALAQGGRFKAAGVGVGITGMGARFGVIDDPFKDRKAAESEVVRDSVWEWFTSAFATRLTPDARVCITHTRWHPDDLVARITNMIDAGEGDMLGGLKWRHLNLLAIYDDPNIVDPMGRQLGEALWPERYSLERLLGIKALSEYDFEALYQQRPRKRGGQVFSDAPARYEKPVVDGARIVVAADTASSQRKTADYTAFTVMAGHGQLAELSADILEVRHARLDLTQLGVVALELQARYGCEIVLEETAQSLPILQYLRTLGVRVKGVRPVGDKFTRAQPLASAWNAGRVRLPMGAPWVSPFLSEFGSFTGTTADDHDDQVDATAYAWAELLRPVVIPVNYTPRQYRN